MREHRLIIIGQAYSKANSRQMFKSKRTGKIFPAKSNAAKVYENGVKAQIVAASPIFDEELSVTIHMFYRNERPDLDPSVLLDCMQGKIYKNDRQVREMHLFHHIDKQNPRAEIVIRPRIKK